MVSLDDLVEAEIPKPPCRTGLWVASLPEDVRESLQRHIEKGTRVAPLHRACEKLDPPVPVGYMMFNRHVRGLCQC